MAQHTINYNLIVPEVGDNVIVDILEIGVSNTTIDSTMKSLSDEDNYLQLQISDNYTVLDTKIDDEVNILNHRIDNIILNSAPLPEVAAQEVMDARYSSVYDITFDVLTDRITYDEQQIVDTQAQVAEFLENYAMIIRLGGIG